MSSAVRASLKRKAKWKRNCKTAAYKAAERKRNDRVLRCYGQELELTPSAMSIVPC